MLWWFFSSETFMWCLWQRFNSSSSIMETLFDLFTMFNVKASSGSVTLSLLLVFLGLLYWCVHASQTETSWTYKFSCEVVVSVTRFSSPLWFHFRPQVFRLSFLGPLSVRHQTSEAGAVFWEFVFVPGGKIQLKQTLEHVSQVFYQTLHRRCHLNISLWSI